MARTVSVKNFVLRALTILTALAIAPLVTAQPSDAAAASAPSPTAAQRVKTQSGLQYEDIKTGTGDVARSGHLVTVHYTGWLKSRDGSTGRKFDSSRDSNQPFTFRLGSAR